MAAARKGRKGFRHAGRGLLHGPQRLHDLPGFGKTALAFLRENQRALRGHIEHPVRTLDELRLHAELRGDFGRQTGGPWQVVSAYAVGDAQVHELPRPGDCRSHHRIIRGFFSSPS